MDMIKQQRDSYFKMAHIVKKQIVPRCQFCGRKNCYEITATASGVFMTQYLFHNKNPICKDCFKFMVNAGVWYTCLLESLLKIRFFLNRRAE